MASKTNCIACACTQVIPCSSLAAPQKAPLEGLSTKAGRAVLLGPRAEAFFHAQEEGLGELVVGAGAGHSLSFALAEGTRLGVYNLLL